jgi:hypothetical protein
MSDAKEKIYDKIKDYRLVSLALLIPTSVSV